MAGLMKKFCNGLSYSTISHIFRVRSLQKTKLIVSSKHYATDEPKTTDEVLFDLEKEEPKSKYTEEEIEKMRDVSRLDPHLKDILHRKLPDMSRPCFQNLKFQRKMYAKFGEASGVNPKLLWPTRSEIRQIMEEDEKFDQPLDEMLIGLKTFQKEREMRFKTKEKNIDEKMSKMVEMISEYRAKIREKRANKRRAEAYKEDMSQTVRYYYGYRISRKDPKFKAIVKQKKEEARERMKEAKAAKKQKRAEKSAERVKARLQNVIKDTVEKEESIAGDVEEKVKSDGHS